MAYAKKKTFTPRSNGIGWTRTETNKTTGQKITTNSSGTMKKVATPTRASVSKARMTRKKLEHR